jgi:ethanolamine ammonia-lyase large subunit
MCLRQQAHLERILVALEARRIDVCGQECVLCHVLQLLEACREGGAQHWHDGGKVP